MPKPPFADVLTYIRTICGQRQPDLTDSQLLDRFVTERDETAFALLVQRHGPVVLGVCRRVLDDAHAVEDAFQATFLVLARRAAAIRKRSSIGTWLHGVAHRVALRARGQQIARRNLERRASHMPRSEPIDSATWQELRTVLDEEIAALPEKYAAPIVLCYLQDKTFEAAAKELRCSKSALGRRVALARDLLRERLIRRGITLSAGAVAGALCSKANAGPVGALLTIGTVKAAMCFATGNAAAVGKISATALGLAQQAICASGGITQKLVLLVLAAGLAVCAAGLAAPAMMDKNPGTSPVGEAAVQPTERMTPAKVAASPVVQPDGEPLPAGALARLGTDSLRDYTSSFAFSPDGKTLATPGCLWDVVTGRPIVRFDVPRFSFTLGFSPNGKTIVTGDFAGPVLFDAGTGKEIRRIDGGRLGTLLFSSSPDARIVAGSQHGRGIALWDMETGEELPLLKYDNFNQARASALACSPDGKTVAVGSNDKSIGIWDVATAKKTRQIDAHGDYVAAVAFSPTGKTLASASMDGAKLWELETGKLLRHLLPGEGLFNALAFSPDGKTLATGGQGGIICLWDPQTGKEFRKWVGKTQLIVRLAFSPDGKMLASSGLGDHVVRFWDPATGTAFSSPTGHTGTVLQLQFASDGKSLATLGADRKVLTWDMTTGKQRRQLFWGPIDAEEALWLHVRSALSPDGKTVARARYPHPMDKGTDNVIRLWSIAEGKELPALSGHTDGIIEMQFSPDSKFLASSDKEGIRIWDWSAARLHWRMDYREEVPYNSSFAFAQNSAVFASLDDDNQTISVRDVRTGKLLRKWDSGAKRQGKLLFSPDSKLLVFNGTEGDTDGVSGTATLVRLWDAETGKSLLKIDNNDGRMGSTTCAFSPSGRVLAFGWSSGTLANNASNSIHLIEVFSGQEIRKLDLPKGHLGAFAFTPDGRAVATCGEDTTILLWDLTGRLKGDIVPGPLNADQLGQLWSDLAGDASKADRALWSMALSPAQSLCFLKENLRPAPATDPIELAKLMADLDGTSFAMRESAARKLENLGESSEAVLHKALAANPSLEMRRRLEKLLEKREQFVVRGLRAIDALEQIATPEAQQVLEALAKDSPNPRMASAAAGALARVTKR
jgi:RNA polymerase sigma factor (sigma-70 family)